MRTSKTKPAIVSLPGCPIIICIPQTRMTIAQYARMSEQSEFAVKQQADAGKFILAKDKRGKHREINMLAELLRDYEEAQEALKEVL